MSTPTWLFGRSTIDAAGAVGAAAEVEVLAAAACRGCGSRRTLAARRWPGAAAADRLQRHQQRLALDLGLVGGGLLEVQHQPGAVAGLHHVDRAQVALVDVDGGAARGRWSRPGSRARCAPAPGSRSRRARPSAAARSRCARLPTPPCIELRDRLDRRSAPAPTQQAAPTARSAANGASSRRQVMFVVLVHFDLSCSCSVAVRSIHSPAASCTISRRATSVSLTLVIRP